MYFQNEDKLLPNILSHLSSKWLGTIKRCNATECFAVIQNLNCAKSFNRLFISSSTSARSLHCLVSSGTSCAKLLPCLVTARIYLRKVAKLSCRLRVEEHSHEKADNADYVWHRMDRKSIKVTQSENKWDKDPCITSNDEVDNTLQHWCWRKKRVKGKRVWEKQVYKCTWLYMPFLH